MEVIEALEKELTVLDQRLAKGEEIIESTPSDDPITRKLVEQYRHLMKRKAYVGICIELLKDKIIVLSTVDGNRLLVYKSSKLASLLSEAGKLGVTVSGVEAKGIREEH